MKLFPSFKGIGEEWAVTACEVVSTGYVHWKKKLSHFDLKSWVTDGTKIWLGIPSNWRIFESNWLDIEAQFNLTLNIESIWLKYSSIIYTRNPGSNISSISDSTFKVKKTLFFLSVWHWWVGLISGSENNLIKSA